MLLLVCVMYGTNDERQLAGDREEREGRIKARSRFAQGFGFRQYRVC
jgi:hypothetical protein